jgi:hypothetical protein
VEQYIQIKDITVNVRFVTEFLSNITQYDLYDLRDGETPEILAERFYGAATYHWAIMLANDRYDYINDFPIASNVFEEYVYQKYNAPFDAAGWSYVGSIITVTQPNHGLLTTNTHITLSNAHTTIVGNGTISTIAGSNTIVGSGTSFNTQIIVGATLLDSTGIVIGVVSNVVNSTHLILVENANISLLNLSYQIETALTGTYQVSAVTLDAFSFNHLTPLTGTPSRTMTVTPSGLTNYTHHYETENGLVVDSDWVGKLAVSNYTYEDRLNESKRVIKVISKGIIEQVAREYAKAMG